jgi:hypothetical protein
MRTTLPAYPTLLHFIKYSSYKKTHSFILNHFIKMYGGVKVNVHLSLPSELYVSSGQLHASAVGSLVIIRSEVGWAPKQVWMPWRRQSLAFSV